MTALLLAVLSGLVLPGRASAQSDPLLAPGSYFISAVVDVGGTVAEGIENNNGFTAPGRG